MRGRFRVPLSVVAGALLGLIVLLATLQYTWLGQISNAERDRMRRSLGTRTSEFAQEFDGEITRAYLLFQVEPVMAGENVAARVAARYDRWQATARHPRMIKEMYFVQTAPDGSTKLQRFDSSTRFLEPAEWPDALKARGRQLTARKEPSQSGTLIVRSLSGPVWEEVPALVVPTPVVFTGQGGAVVEMHVVTHSMAYTVLVLDRGYIVGEML